MVLSKHDYKSYFIAFIAFFSVYPYFIWGYYGVIIIGIFLIFILSYILIFREIHTNKTLVSGFIIIFFIYMIFYIKDFGVSSLFWGLLIAFFSSSPTSQIIKAFFIFRKIIVYSLLPAALLWLLHVSIGNNTIFHLFTIQPFNPVKIEYQIEFYSYIVAIIPSYDVPSSFYRFSGLFEEPGVVGTVCSLILVAAKLNLKDNENKLLILYGVISFSLAFYVVIFLYILLFKVRRIKNIIIIIISSLILYIFAIYNKFFQKYIVSRFVIDSETGFAGNNRSSDYLDYMFDQWASLADLNVFLFGLNNVINDGYSSIKQIPVEKGIIGLVMFLIFIIFLTIKNRISNNLDIKIILIFCIFLMSLYQRPDVFSLYFILIYSFAIINHTNFNKKEIAIND